jgi:hypothetical protein
MASKYRKKPVVIEALQWTGDNWLEMDAFLTAHHSTFPKDGFLIIHTLEGPMRADNGDYIIKGIQGEFYPCKPTIFESTYDKVAEE